MKLAAGAGNSGAVQLGTQSHRLLVVSPATYTTLQHRCLTQFEKIMALTKLFFLSTFSARQETVKRGGLEQGLTLPALRCSVRRSHCRLAGRGGRAGPPRHKAGPGNTRSPQSRQCQVVGAVRGRGTGWGRGAGHRVGQGGRGNTGLALSLNSNCAQKLFFTSVSPT